ncbi:MAG: S8/S53 family peptidase [Deltaproteobacteria bacterium]|nr:S8/S53 family peptidase [Deltaproteobacteria bacterium]NND28084.1 S8/S53 family peptidase [Myxococcales bacterium]MBT8463274.1 S8/S53 family peptidase [Deltaproteobacteria bacterium]NNK09491.1 S8/S53 family peptidase [Myxococcales bacterium]NNK41585.1 S8/S53 family peptidase [Myxococcales bacterium]
MSNSTQTHSTLVLARGQLRGRVARLLVAVMAALICGTACTNVQAPAARPGKEAVPGSSEIELRLNSVIYRDGQDVQVVLDFGGRPAPEGADVLLVGSESEDVEVLRLVRETGNRMVSTGRTRVGRDSDDVGDGTLALSSKEMFTALYFVDQYDPAFADSEVSVIADFGIFAADLADVAGVEVVAEVALSPAELDPPLGGKRVGTVLPRGGLPVQIATDELVLFTDEAKVLEAFLAKSDGSLVRTEPLFDENGDESGASAYLVRVDPMLVGADDLPQLRDFLGEEDDLRVSNEEVAGIYASAIHYMIEGFPVAVNPKLQFHGAPSITPTEEINLAHSTTMKSPTTEPCIPGSGNPCVLNVPAMWAFNALWDGDDREIPVAVLDQGFANVPDIRSPAGAARLECDMTGSSGPSCGPGSAIGAPTVGNSFFGDKTWHGTGVAAVIGAVVNNGIETAGVGGQVAVPRYYKYDLAGYAFEIGSGFRKATDDGAACINISGGYPCKILTNIGPDFDICTEGGRTGLCAAIGTVLAAAVGTTCGAAGVLDLFLPGAGALICSVAATGATFSTAACFSTLAFGDLAGAMQSGAYYATGRGVPIVASAGNTLDSESLPPIIRDYVDLSDRTVDNWRTVPAAFRNVITVGAVNSTSLDNEHFYGNFVDIWAPIGSNYYAPTDTTDPSSSREQWSIGGTSAAAPYVAGVVAAMQAMNRDLDPRTYDPEADFGVSRELRRAIPGRILDLLTDPANSFSNDELVALGYSDQPEERRILVNPLLALQAAAAERPFSPFFDLADEGFDASLNFSEVLEDGLDDTAATARPIEFSVSETGTILSIPAEGAAASRADVDWFAFTMPYDENPNQLFETTVEVQYPMDPDGDGVGLLQALGGSSTLIRSGGSLVYKVVARPSRRVAIKLGSVSGDNVYKVTVDEPVLARPSVRIVTPIAGPDLCDNSSHTLEAEAIYDAFPYLDVPNGELEWRLDGVSLGTGRSISRILPVGTHELSVRAFGDPSISDSMTVNVNDCDGLPPFARIISPSPTNEYAEGFDSNGYYLEVTLSAEAYDRDPGGSVTVTWTTSRGDLQPEGEVLATGTNATVRLYTECNVAEHEIVLRVEDEDGNVAQGRVLVSVGLLC